MLRKPISMSVLALVAAFGNMNTRAADQPSAAETKLRESLRATMLQLRNAETERANLQTTQAELEGKNKMLAEEVEKVSKKAADDKSEAEKTIAELQAKMVKGDMDIGQLRVTLEKANTENKRITDIANAKEAQRAKLAEKVILLDRRVVDQKTRNAEMYKLGIELLSRYEKFGLGTALTAREPFVGLTRVKFENLIQDYSDKLEDSRIKPEPVPKPAPKP